MSTMTSIPENKENVALVWFDPAVNTSDDDLEQIKEDRRAVNNFIRFPIEIDLCVDLIQSITEEKIFLIISCNNVFKHRSKIDGLSKLCAIFIFPDNRERYQRLIDKYPNVVDIFDNPNRLIESITDKVKRVNRQMEIISFYDQHQQSARELSEQSGDFLW